MSSPRTSIAFATAFLAFAAARPGVAQTLIAQSTGGPSASPLGLDDVEITPDQRYAVIRENNAGVQFRVHDLATGALVSNGISGSLIGECLDAVAVTNTRAVVLGGRSAYVLDLTQVPTVIRAEIPAGSNPRDVAITPDGTMAAVRGGNPLPGIPNGLFVIDLASGAVLASAPGTTNTYFGSTGTSWNLDAVAVSDQHAVFLSTPSASASARTRVTIFTLRPSGGGPPVKSYETSGPIDLFGAPHDVAMSPDGLHVAVRSELNVAVFDLSNADVPVMAFGNRLYGSPGPFEDTAMDSIEVTNTRVVTISRVTNPLLPQGAQIDVFDMSGVQRYHRMAGSPHDLAITPDGRRAIVRTSEGVTLLPIENLGAGPALTPLDHAPAPSAGNWYEGGLDSIEASNDNVVTLAQSPGLSGTIVHFWHIADDRLDFIAQRTIANSRPVDLAMTSDGAKVAVAGNSGVAYFHVETGMQTFDTHVVGPTPYYQWCDGVAVSDDKVAAVGQWGPQNGWFAFVDTTPYSTQYCTSTPNSSGQAATIRALGNESVAANNLKLFVEGAPVGARGRFVYGSGQQQVPFGDGFQCVGGSLFGLRLLDANLAGAAGLAVNYGAQTIPAGIIQPGSNWNFQFIFFDPKATGFGLNSSDALSITFAP